MTKCSDYNKTFDGLTLNMYGHHNERSKLRNHPLPTYTLQELREWVRAQPGRAEMFKSWSNSNYDINLTPSIDRLDENLGYIFSNMKLVTWQENNSKEHQRKARNESGRGRSVTQLKDGIVVGIYASAKEAADNTLAHQSGIVKCLLGKRKTSGGYSWRLTKEKDYECVRRRTD